MFQFVVVIILGAQVVLSLASGNAFKLASESFWCNPCSFVIFLASWYVHAYLYISQPRPGMSHFFKKLWLFLVGNVII